MFQSFSNITLPKLLMPLWGLILILIPLSIVLIFFQAPVERVMGPVQKIFFFHVPMAMTSFLAFFLVFLFSLLYLIKRVEVFNAYAYSAAEVGVMFCGLVLLTGMLWARPIWGIWWTWDPRLTSTLILFLIYVVYLILQQNAEQETKFKRFAAVFGIIGFVDVPIVYLSIHLWRTIHPSLMKKDGLGLDSSMRPAFYLSITAILTLFVGLWLLRTYTKILRQEIDQLHEEILDAGKQ